MSHTTNPMSGNLLIYQGDDYAAVVSVKGPSGTPADLSGYTARAQIRRSFADKDPVIVCEIATVISSSDIFLTIPNDTTRSLTGRYFWDLQLVSSGGIVTTIMAGSVTVTQEVTRDPVILLSKTGSRGGRW